MTPAALLALAHEHKAQCSIENNILTVKSTHDFARIDVTTGRLLEFNNRDEEQDETPRINITFQKGAFDRRLEELRTAVAGHKDTLDPDRPFSSVGRFLAGDETFWTHVAWDNEHEAKIKADPRIYPIARKLLDNGILAPLDAVWNEYFGKDDDFHFELRDDQSFTQKGIIGFGAQFVLLASDMLFPRDSWPATLTREAALSAVGKGKHTRTEMLSLYASKDTGPVCCLVAGALAPCFTTDLTWAHLFGMGLERPSNNELARAFGAKGLERLSLDDFRKDYQFLLRPDHPIAKYADQVVAALGTLSDEDLAVLLQQTPPEHARYMAQGLRVLHQQRGRSAVAVLPDMLDAMWQSGLQEQVKAALKRLTTDGSLWIKSEEPSNVSPSK